MGSTELGSEIKSIVELHWQDEAPFLRSRVKRSADILFALIGLIITLVVFPFVAIAIKLDSRGPVLFRQLRLGLDGQEFQLIKFRTMVVDAESATGPIWATPNDPRVTTVGRLFRSMYIDELPQWWNVLKGQMSVVGPRPERPEFYAIILERYPEFARRLGAKPGITGLAQTEYRYANSISKSRHKLSYDQLYLLKASVWLDAWVVLRTFRRILMRRGH